MIMPHGVRQRLTVTDTQEAVHTITDHWGYGLTDSRCLAIARSYVKDVNVDDVTVLRDWLQSVIDDWA